MSRLVAALATVGIGALIACQPPINSELARRTGNLGAAFVSLTVSAVAMGVVFAVFGDAQQLRKLTHVPALYLSGGLLGAAFVGVSLITVRTLGAGSLVAAAVTGQLVVSAVLDRFGVLGLKRVGLSPARLVGFALLFAGTALVTAR